MSCYSQPCKPDGVWLFIWSFVCVSGSYVPWPVCVAQCRAANGSGMISTQDWISRSLWRCWDEEDPLRMTQLMCCVWVHVRSGVLVSVYMMGDGAVIPLRTLSPSSHPITQRSVLWVYEDEICLRWLNYWSLTYTSLFSEMLNCSFLRWKHSCFKCKCVYVGAHEGVCGLLCFLYEKLASTTHVRRGIFWDPCPQRVLVTHM